MSFLGLVSHLFLVLKKYFIVGMYHCVSIHLLNDIIVQVLTIMNKDVIKINVQILREHESLPPLDKYQGVQLLDRVTRIPFVL